MNIHDHKRKIILKEKLFFTITKDQDNSFYYNETNVEIPLPVGIENSSLIIVTGKYGLIPDDHYSINGNILKIHTKNVTVQEGDKLEILIHEYV